jgi:hypothetical protein
MAGMCAAPDLKRALANMPNLSYKYSYNLTKGLYMKRILSIIAISTLVGCANVTFDANEFDRYVTIKLLSDKAKASCGTLDVQSYVTLIDDLAIHEQIYAQYKWGSSQMLTASTNLSSMVSNFNNMLSTAPVSKKYCEEKMDNISQGAIRVMQTVGRF